MSDISKLTEEEVQLYDRQIRLWGIEAQNRLKNSKILIIGVNGVSCEIIKNLVLTGINKIGLCDELVVTEEDVNNNFLIRRDSVGENRAMAAKLRTENLNPRVIVEVHETLPKEINSHKESNNFSITEFDMVICCSSSMPSCPGNLWHISNEACREALKYFMAVESFGLHALAFIDIGAEHTYLKEEHEPVKPGETGQKKDSKWVPFVKHFCPFSAVPVPATENGTKGDGHAVHRRVPRLVFFLIAMQKAVSEARRHWRMDEAVTDDIGNMQAMGLTPVTSADQKTFRECRGPGVVPVNAVMGGLVTHEVFKAISGKGEPVGNFIVFNGDTCSAEAATLVDSCPSSK